MSAPTPLPFISYRDQLESLEALQVGIDTDLRQVGFEAVLRDQGLDPDIGKIVVGRSFIYSTQKADQLGRDFDPLASRMGVYREVGIFIGSMLSGARSWRMFEVSRSLFEEEHEPYGAGTGLSAEQFETVHSSISTLMSAKKSFIPSLEKDLKSI